MFPQIKLVAPPLYVMTVTSMDKDKAIQMLEKSLQIIREKITSYGGELVVKVPVFIFLSFHSQIHSFISHFF